MSKKDKPKRKPEAEIIDPTERKRQSAEELSKSGGQKDRSTLVIAPGELTEKLTEELAKTKEAKTEIVDPTAREKKSLEELRESGLEEDQAGTLVIKPGQLTDRLLGELRKTKQEQAGAPKKTKKSTVGKAKLTCANPDVLKVPGAETIMLDKPEITLGRGKDNSVPVVANRISRNHVRLFPGDKAWTVVDLGSTNGIKVNGVKVEKAFLRPGDQLEIGDAVYTFALVG